MAVVSDDDNQAVIDKVTKDGTFDEIRKQVVEQLKKDDSLKKLVAEMVENSQTLCSHDVTRLQKQQLLHHLRKELEQELLEHASKSAWEVMCSKQSPVTSFIDEKVHEALCSVYQERRQQAALATASYARQAPHAQHAQAMFYPHHQQQLHGAVDPYHQNFSAQPSHQPYYAPHGMASTAQQRHPQHGQHPQHAQQVQHHAGYGAQYGHAPPAQPPGYGYGQGAAYPPYTQPHAAQPGQHPPPQPHYPQQPSGQAPTQRYAYPQPQYKSTG